jgi:hypothetical protein
VNAKSVSETLLKKECSSCSGCSNKTVNENKTETIDTKTIDVKSAPETSAKSED